MEEEEEELLQAALPAEENVEAEEELDIYTEDGIDEYMDDDSISPSEQGFMKGYLEAWWKCSTSLKEISLNGKITRER